MSKLKIGPEGSNWSWEWPEGEEREESKTMVKMQANRSKKERREIEALMAWEVFLCGGSGDKRGE